MKVTLRKANAIQNNINEVIRGIEISDVVKLNEYQNAETVIKEESEKVLKDLTRKSALISALYSIRKQVGIANATAGVDERLTSVACIEKFIQMWTEQTKRTLRTDFEVLRFKAEKMRKSENDRHLYYGGDALSSGTATQADIDSAKATLAFLKRDKQKLQDEILELNVRTEVELSEEVLTVLRSEGLI